MAVQAAQLIANVSVTGVAESTAKLGEMSGAVDRTSGMMKGLLVGAAVAGATALVGLGVKSLLMAADYEQGMNKVKALTGASDAAMKQYDAGLKQLASDAGVAPKKLTDGLYNVLSASFKGADAMKVLTLATEDAKIGMTSATVSTDGLTNILRAFSVQGKDFTRVNGEMLQTVTLGKATFEQYATAIVKPADAAVQFKVSMETMNAAWATMTSSGIHAAQASTDFTQSLKVMYSNIGTVTKSLEKNGIAFNEAKFNTLSYGDKVQMLSKALEEANAKHVKITGVTLQAAQAISVISNHIKDYNSNLATLSDKQAMAQKTAQAWAITQQGFNQTLDRVKASFSVFMVDIGQVFLPIVTKAINGLLDLGQKIRPIFGQIGAAFQQVFGPLNNASQSLMPLGKALGSITPIIKPVSDAFGQAADAIRKTKEAVNPLFASFNQATGVFNKTKEAVNPFVGIFKQIAAVLLEIPKVYPGIQKVADIFKGEFSTDIQFALKWAKQISQWFQAEMLPAIKQAMPGFIALSKALINDLAPALAKAWAKGQQIYRLIASDVIPVFEKVAPIVVKLAGFLADKLGKAIVFLSPYISQAADAIGKFAKEISDRVMPIINNFFDALNKNMPTIKAIWNATWPVMASVLKGVWDMIAGVVKVAWAIVSGLIKIGLDILSGNWKQAWNDLLTMLGGIWDGIKTFLSGALRVIIQVILGKGQDVQDAVIKPFQQAYDFVTGLFGKLGGIINDTLSNIGKRINDLHIPGLPKFASGVENFGGGMAYVHAGEVITYLPPGSSVTPASKVSSMMSSQGKQPVQIIVNLAGRRVGQVLLPDIAQAIRYGVGGVL